MYSKTFNFNVANSKNSLIPIIFVNNTFGNIIYTIKKLLKSKYFYWKFGVIRSFKDIQRGILAVTCVKYVLTKVKFIEVYFIIYKSLSARIEIYIEFRNENVYITCIQNFSCGFALFSQIHFRMESKIPNKINI